MNCQTTQNLLDGFADGELDLLNYLEIEQHLKDCSSCSQIYKNQIALKSAFADNSLYFQAPANLKKRVQTSIGESNKRPPVKLFRQWRRLAAALSFAVVIAMILVFFPRSDNDELLAREFVAGHIRSLMANHLSDVQSTDQHTVKPWFDGKLDFSPPVIDLGPQGFSLVGGRLDYIANRPVAALIYQRRQHYINLFVFPSRNNAGTGNKISVRQGYNLIHWEKSGMTFWAISDLNLNELLAFTEFLQMQI